MHINRNLSPGRRPGDACGSVQGSGSSGLMMTPYHERSGGGGSGGRGDKQVVINKKRRRRRRRLSLLSVEEQNNQERNPDPSSNQRRRWSSAVLLLGLCVLGISVVQAEDTLQSTELPSISSISEEGNNNINNDNNINSNPGGVLGPGPPFRPSFVPPSPQQLTPCDRSRKVFTSASGEISDGPTGANYTQASTHRIEL